MDKNNQGAFFVNDKRKTDTHPHYKGSANINSQDFYVSIWSNTSKEGKKYWSMKFEAKPTETEQAKAAPPPAVVQPDDDDSDELPF